eukprot:1158864-Pelagomonas_calceolata.AAC.1
MQGDPQTHTQYESRKEIATPQRWPGTTPPEEHEGGSHAMNVAGSGTSTQLATSSAIDSLVLSAVERDKAHVYVHIRVVKKPSDAHPWMIVGCPFLIAAAAAGAWGRPGAHAWPGSGWRDPQRVLWLRPAWQLAGQRLPPA